MKHNLVQLESFDTGSGGAEHILMTPAEVEEARLAAFEQGYSAGWEDSAATREAAEAKMRAAVGQALQDMSFTYHEARHHLLESLRPLIEAMTEKILPAAARTTLPRIVAEQVQSAAEKMMNAPIAVAANPSVIPDIHNLIADYARLPLSFNADPGLTEGQVYLRFPETETRIDLDEVIAKIASAIDTHFSANPQETNHG